MQTNTGIPSIVWTVSLEVVTTAFSSCENTHFVDLLGIVPPWIRGYGHDDDKSWAL